MARASMRFLFPDQLSESDASSASCESVPPVAFEHATWECPVCYMEQDAATGWSCPDAHRFCLDCMGGLVAAVQFPRCPLCPYELIDADLQVLHVPSQRIQLFKEARLQGAIDTLAESGEVLIKCLRVDCMFAALVAANERRIFTCEACDAPPFCTKCKQTPYHYHAACHEVQWLREKYMSWISGGREKYLGCAQTSTERDARSHALQDAMSRHQELEADEAWKQKYCRLCPECKRVIQRVNGCSAMVCGEDTHGGNQQHGCGHRFNWHTAEAYEASILQHHPCRKLKRVAKQRRFRGRAAFHPFTDCSLCGQQGFSGIRFRCVHCEAFNICECCEPQLAEFHDPEHVFEVLYESDFRCSSLEGVPPKGTKVRLVRSGKCKPRSVTTNFGEKKLEGLLGTIVGMKRSMSNHDSRLLQVQLELGLGSVVLESSFLEPVITSRAEAEALSNRMMPAMRTPVRTPDFDPGVALGVSAVVATVAMPTVVMLGTAAAAGALAAYITDRVVSGNDSSSSNSRSGVRRQRRQERAHRHNLGSEHGTNSSS